MASESRNIRTLVGDWVRFGPGWPRDTLAKSRKGLLSVLASAMANPDPEIDPAKAREVRPDAIIATGRSDYPNQVNNVLGFPSIFRGALDTRSTQINEDMKLAAVHALATLAREEVPDRVSDTYGGKNFAFGRDYLIPKPFDTRVLLWVAPAVAKAAMASGVATRDITNWEEYHDRLEAYQGPSKAFIRTAIHRVHKNASGAQIPKIVFPEGNSNKVLKALKILVDEQICQPILLGSPERVREKIRTLDLKSLEKVQIIQPSLAPQFKNYVQELYNKRQRKGVNLKGRREISPLFNRYIPLIDEQITTDIVALIESKVRAEIAGPDNLIFGFKKMEFYMALSGILKAMNLKDKDVHSCRHTFATWLTRMCGGDRRVSEDVLGHSSSDVNKRYVHLAEELEANRSKVKPGQKIAVKRLQA